MTSLELLRKRLRPFAFVIGIGWAFMSAGCYSWRFAPANYGVATDRRDDMRLTMRDTSLLYLYNARVVGDSVVGTSFDRQGSEVSSSVAASQVRRIDVQEFNGGKTAALVFLGIPVALVAVLAIACTASGGCVPKN